jgi:hypothetical protein
LCEVSIIYQYKDANNIINKLATLNIASFVGSSIIRFLINGYMTAKIIRTVKVLLGKIKTVTCMGISDLFQI